jgi:hypothetical protein
MIVDALPLKDEEPIAYSIFVIVLDWINDTKADYSKPYKTL